MAALAPLLDRIAALTPADRQPLVAQFARSTFRRMAPERLAGVDIDAAAAMLVDSFGFIDRRAPGSLALRVFQPEPAVHGWKASGTVVDANVEDGPFLLTTVTEELARLGLEVDELVHPVVGVRRDEAGRITALLPARKAAARESWIHLVLRATLDDGQRVLLDERLRSVLDDARAATTDFPAMRAQIEEIAFQTRASAGARYPADEVDEAMAFLAWLLDDHFVLLGYREYDLIDLPEGRGARVRAGSGLGILADESSSRWRETVLLSDVAPALRERMEGGELLVVARTNATSTVHRHARMMYIGVKKVGGDGRVNGEHRLVGLFAQKAYAEPANAIPVLRRKLRQILEREDVVDHSYDERALRVLFDAFPKHELFAADTNALRRTLVELLEIQRGSDVRLLVRVGELRRSVSVLVAVPRERFNAAIRKRVQQLLVDRLGAGSVDYHLTMTERDRALLHFVLHADTGTLAEVDTDVLEHEVTALMRTWDDDLLVELVRVHGEVEGRRLAAVYAGRFPAGYAATTSVQTALLDIAALERLCPGPDGTACATDVAMTLRADSERSGLVRFNLYKVGAGVELSAFLPILESLGLTVVEEVPYRLDGPGGEGPEELHIHDFGVRVDGVDFDVERDGPRLAAAALAIWRRQAEPDVLNRLVLRAGLSWDEVVVLRTYRRYRRQVGTSFTEPYLDQALVEHPQVARDLIALFDARFDPSRDASPEGVAEIRDRVVAGCDAVARLDQDRILRGYLGLVDATVRTNRWVGRDTGAPCPYLSLKFDSRAVPDMPKPVPFREIFVCSTEMEGVHLRGGPIARGGLRWSDRIEDYRTEVLGLMKAQMVKNAVIVPTGSKGGFVLKRRPEDPQALRTEVQRQYEVFIRGLLDVTDNVTTTDAGTSHVVAPPQVRRADGDDPYLVVAADRGTATFSDVANAICAEFGFWLGDAFASGGSKGYDHKAMGITARGAWVAVQRHFRELGVDVQTEPITVVGIGDMSGDVFGNGLLRSESVKLVAAFDHRDIFLDPDPDPAAAFAERSRLYELPRSSWQHYARERISPGGGVWPRTLKRVPLSGEVRALLGVDAAELSPPELIQAILRAPVDLLFAGGIGTFVKGSDETAADVGDRANDAIRIDASHVGARVVGEGGNLAFTQRARIQYARRGGRVNTDAIDNSAGVDTSDHEVNLKILLAAAAAAGALAADDRDALLAAVSDDVADAVLRDVYLQTWAISHELATSPGGMEAYETLMVDLERPDDAAVPGGAVGAAATSSGHVARLDREVEVLPSTAEMERRRAAGAGLTRPELAVLLAYAKVDLSTRLLATDLPDQPFLQETLRAYFPRVVAERFAQCLPEHRLRRDLVATVVANDVVNRMGITFVNRTTHELGTTAVDVAAAYWTARTVCDADAHWRAVEGLDGGVDPALQLELKAEVDRLVDAFTRSYVRHPVGDIGAAVALDRPAFRELENAVAEGAFGRRSDRVERYVERGIDPDVAERVVGLGVLTLVPDVAAVARSSGQPVRHVAEVFFRLTELLPFDALGRHLRGIQPAGHWERWQHRGLLDDLRELRRAAAEQTIAGHPDALAAEAVERFLCERAAAHDRVATVVGVLGREGGIAGLPGVAVGVRALREVVAAGQPRAPIAT